MLLLITLNTYKIKKIIHRFSSTCSYVKENNISILWISRHWSSMTLLNGLRHFNWFSTIIGFRLKKFHTKELLKSIGHVSLNPLNRWRWRLVGRDKSVSLKCSNKRVQKEEKRGYRKTKLEFNAKLNVFCSLKFNGYDLLC